MTRSYVFVDVETTGLNDKRDRIIEVAAVVWEGGEVIESFSSLVDPERDIPFEITQLTGIDNAMVREAPHMSAIHRKLSTLIGDRIVVGHNVDFDLGFLKAEDLAFGNHKIDTVVLASILAPESGRFNLEHLVHHFDLPQTVAHRAEADAHHTLNLFVKLQEICMQQDALLIEEIVEVSIAIRWPEALFFQDVLTTRAQATFSRDGEAVRSRRQRDHQLLHLPRIEGKILPDPSELEPEKEQPIDIEAVTGMFKTGSNFSRVFPNFEPRKEQVQMVSAVAGALNKHKHLMVEAGTGTGKSLAYLIPAAFWAHQNDRRVVISTNTINLQDQLINKDIPAMNKALPFKIEVAVRKGRRNYVCGALFGRLRQHLPNNKDEMALFARMLLWLPKTKTGDVAEIPLRTVAERKAWRELSGEQSRCNQTGCTAEDCAVTHARRRAESAHIVIVNHALLMSDVANENHILPPFKELIIDEAHHFEAAVTGGMSFSADPQSLTALLDNLTNNTLKVLETDLMSLPKGAYDDLRNHWWLVEQGATTARLRLQELFATLAFFGGSYWNKKSPFPESVRLVREVRDSDGFRLVRRDWANLNINFKSIIKHISALDKGIGQLQGNNIEFEKDQEWCKILGSVYKDIEKVRDKLDKIIEHED
ncbi:MAG: exonuclease domain-containing protein, partial [Candidatus Promineifilaceae bacterium]